MTVFVAWLYTVSFTPLLLGPLAITYPRSQSTRPRSIFPETVIPTLPGRFVLLVPLLA